MPEVRVVSARVHLLGPGQEPHHLLNYPLAVRGDADVPLCALEGLHDGKRVPP